MCHQLLIKVDANLLKILFVNNKYVSIKKPMNCKSVDIYLLLQNSHGIIELLKVDSLHSMIKSETVKLLNSNILPLGQLSNNQVESILSKHSSIQFLADHSLAKRNNPYPCHLHTVYSNNQAAYGFFTLKKASNVIGNYFNSYKKVGRKNR
jgi:hypothetical protein